MEFKKTSYLHLMTLIRKKELNNLYFYDKNTDTLRCSTGYTFGLDELTEEKWFERILDDESGTKA